MPLPSDSSNPSPSIRWRSARARARHGLFSLVAKLLGFIVVPAWRSAVLRLLGADIGRNVRVHEVHLFNLSNGFRHLSVADDVYIGPGTRIDLEARVRIGAGSVISTECLLLSHTDVGEHHGSPLVEIVPTIRGGVEIGSFCYLGARSMILPSVSIGPRTVVAAGAVVTSSFGGNGIIAGVPARLLRAI